MERIGSYRITRLIEEGGVAVVYQAIQESLDRPVAIKVLQQKFTEDSRMVDYFNRESLIIARLIHPNIIHVIDRGLTEDNMPYFVMDYIEGTNTARLIMEGKLTFTRKLDIVIQTCKALAYAHKNGIIHRDIKPANILVDTEGNALVADFGIAQFYESSTEAHPGGKAEVLGTPSYMSPEQKKNSRDASFASDIYSLGVVMAELFTGKRLPKGQPLPSPLAPDVPPNLEQLILQCLSPEPENRPSSVEVIKNQLFILSQGAHIDINRKNKAMGGVPAMNDIFAVLDIIRENDQGATYLLRHKQRGQLLVARTFKALNKGIKTARLLMSLKHDGIVAIQGVSGNTGNHLVVMEYLPGGSLADRMVMPQPWHEALRIIKAVCTALQFAHSNRITHGNLKPVNILFTQSDAVKLSDFRMADGDSEATQGQENLKDLIQADIFATGEIFYKMVMGFSPVLKGDSFAPHKQFKTLPSDIRLLISRFLSRKPDLCIQSMAEALSRISRIYGADNLSDKTVVSLDDALSESAALTRQIKAEKQKRRWLTAALVFILILVAVLGLTLL